MASSPSLIFFSPAWSWYNRNAFKVYPSRWEYLKPKKIVNQSQKNYFEQYFDTSFLLSTSIFLRWTGRIAAEVANLPFQSKCRKQMGTSATVESVLEMESNGWRVMAKIKVKRKLLEYRSWNTRLSPSQHFYDFSSSGLSRFFFHNNILSWFRRIFLVPRLTCYDCNHALSSPVVVSGPTVINLRKNFWKYHLVDARRDSKTCQSKATYLHWDQNPNHHSEELSGHHGWYTVQMYKLHQI